MKTMIKYLSFVLLLISSCGPGTSSKATKETTVVSTSPVQKATIPTAPSTSPQKSIETNVITSNVGIDLSASVPTDPSIRSGVLPNGMKYYLKKNAKPENRVELRLAVKAGSMQEDDDQLGIAHFVEHMSFNGTKNFKKQELIDYLETVGTRFGADLNARTGFDQTVYLLQVRTDDQEKLQKGLLVVEDWASGVAFDPTEIDKERGVVMSEWRTGLSPNQRIFQKTLPVMLFNSRYAKRLPIGNPESLEKVPYDAVKRFYKDWYRPELMAVMAVGDMDLDKMETELKSRFSKIPSSPATARKREESVVPMHPDTKVVIATDKEASFTQAQLFYKHVKKLPSTIQDYRSGLLADLYNRMIAVRLDEISQKPNPPFNFASSNFGDFLANLNCYASAVGTDEGKALKGLETVMVENERVYRFGFTSTEFQRQKEELLRGLESSVKEKDKTESANIVESMVNNFLENSFILSPEQELELTKKLLPTIDLMEINILPKKWMADEGRVITVTGPEKPGLVYPTETEILNTLNSIKSLELQPYEDKVSDEPLMSKDLPAVDIINEKSNDLVGTKEFQLKNGLKVVLKKTEFKNDEILMSAYSPGGASLYNDEDDINCGVAADLVSNAGLGKLDQIQLQKRLTGKIVSVNPYISNLYEGMSGNASPQDLELLFQLIYLYFTEPRKDLDAYKSFMDKQKGFLKNIEANPQFYFMIESNKIKTQNHPREQFPTSDKLEKVNFDRAYQIYKERFSEAGDFTFVFTGNFDENQLKLFAREYLGNLPSTGKKEMWRDLKVSKPTGIVTKSLIKGEAPKTYVDITYHGDFEWTDMNRYQLTSAVDLLRIKLREALREDKGGVYGVGVTGGATPEPTPKYTVTISFNCDPPRTEELIQAAQVVLANTKEIGADAKDIQKVTETQRQTRTKQLKENRFWSGQIQNAYQYKINPGNILLETFEEKIKTLDANSIKSTLNKYINENSKISITMQPEKKSN
ncbi:MAG: insulinase family protein [Saprospiraceae bacterium]